MNDLEFLRRALDLARRLSAAGSAGPFGAVVVRDGEVVGKGWNQVVDAHDPTAHAEIVAIREAGARLGTHVLADCTLYCSCEPCPMCLGAVYWARIPRLVFAGGTRDATDAGFDDALIAQEMTLSWEKRSVVARRALEEEGRGILLEWARNPHRILY